MIGRFNSEREMVYISFHFTGDRSKFEIMNMSNPLVPGTIKSIYENGASAVENPFVQIIHLKSYEKDSSSVRYK